MRLSPAYSLLSKCTPTSPRHFGTEGPPGGGGETPYNHQYGEAASERGTFLRLQVYERVGKSVISVGKQMHFMVVKKTSKLSGFVIYSYFKDCEFTTVKRDAKVLTRHTICQ